MAHLPMQAHGFPGVRSLALQTPHLLAGMVMGPHSEGCGRRKYSCTPLSAVEGRAEGLHVQELEELRVQTQGQEGKRGVQNWRAVGGREEMSKEEAAVQIVTRLPSTSPKA